MMRRKLATVFAVLPAAVLLAPAYTMSAHAEDAEETVEPEVSVQVAELTRATLRARVTAYGRVEPRPAASDSPAALASLTAPVSGILTQVTAVAGTKVAMGDALFRFDGRVADATVARAEGEVRLAEQTLARLGKLAEVEGTALKNVQEAEARLTAARSDAAAARAERERLTVNAPIAGVITRVAARVAEAVDAGTPLAVLLAPDRLAVAAAVPLREADGMHPGLPAEVCAAGRDDTVTGTVSYVSAEARTDTDTIDARIDLPSGCGLRAGQFVKTQIVVAEHADCMAVPRASLYTDYDGNSAISVVDAGHSKRIEVHTGIRDGERVEISGDGLAQGMSVITVGSYALPDGTKVRIAGEAPAEESR